MAKILLVDDESNVRMTVGTFLTENGHEVMGAKDAVEANILLKNMTFDVAITDNIPPKDNIDILQILRSDYPHIPVVMISGQDKELLRDRAMTIGAFSWMAKPLGKEDICRTVNMALNHKSLLSEKDTLSKEVERFRTRQLQPLQQMLTPQLQHSQKLESIGILASGVAHEINNPLNGILNYAQIISDDSDPNDRMHELADKIIGESKRVAIIVSNLLSFSRQHAEDYRDVSITDVIDAVIPLMSAVLKKEQISVDLDIAPELPNVRCKSQEIQQVLINLITNARDALSEKFPGYDERKTILIKARRFDKKGKSWIRTTVSDQGSGISEGSLLRIFEPFFTTKGQSRGTGLGLSICQKILKAHGGAIRIQSRENEFTRVHFFLPSWEV